MTAKDKAKLWMQIFLGNIVVGTVISLRDACRFLTWNTGTWEISKFFGAWGEELYYCLPWIFIVSAIIAVQVALIYQPSKK